MNYNKNIWMAASEEIPNTPRNPDTIIVNKLMGMCNPIAPPKTLKKNKSNMPMPNFTVLCAINRVGLIGAPIIKSKIINTTMIEITIVGLISFPPLLCPLYITYEK